MREDQSARMFSLMCPHMGNRVEVREDLLVCPAHKWKFDARTGKCVTGLKDLCQGVHIITIGAEEKLKLYLDAAKLR